MSNERVKDSYTAVGEYLDALHNAESLARDERESEFIAGLKEKAEKYGLEAYLSPKQASWLGGILKRGA